MGPEVLVVFARTDWFLRPTAMTVLVACVSLAVASPNIAQHHQQRGPQLFEAVRVEFEQLRRLRWVGGNDTFLRTHIFERIA